MFKNANETVHHLTLLSQAPDTRKFCWMVAGEKARLEMERRMLLQHTTAGALDRLGKSLR